MARAPDAVFAVSNKVRRHSIEIDRVHASRVITIYNGLDLAHWSVQSRPSAISRALLITTIGNIRRVKGHDVFIRAAAMLAPRFPDVTFSIAGDVLEPGYFAELQGLIRELNLSDRFHFAGSVSDLRQHLDVADIFVLPSRNEGFSNAIIEAMAASLPVVATDVGGNAEAVQAGVTGFIVPPNDPAALSAAIEILLVDPLQARSMGAAGRARAAACFTVEAMMKHITTTYANLLSRG
jgi:glycosyltransferase involved in cell wall biosynthesis